MSFLCLFLLGGSCLFQDSTRFVPVAEASERIGLRQLSGLLTKSPEYFYEANTQQLGQIFVKPTLIRHDDPAIVWHYKSDQCVMDVYFIDSGLPQQRVEYVELRNFEGHKISFNEACVKSFMNKVPARDIREARRYN